MTNTICAACSLAATRRNIAKGRGSLPCMVLFIGEGPGKTDDLLGEAFAGPSGRLLDRIIDACGIDKNSFYIDNIVGCRPTDDRRGNGRPPRGDEVLACSRRISLLIEKARPLAIIWVGESAERYYGKIYAGYRMMHPAALLKSGGEASPHYQIVLRGLQSYLMKAGIYAAEKS